MTDFKGKVAKYSGYNFTNSQEQALDALTDWYNNPDEICFTLKGRAGTGKTYILKYFLNDIVKQSVCVTAPTHKAVRQVERSTGRKGKTLQSLHGLRPNINLEDFDLDNVKFDTLGVPTINNYKLVVIDECSMINQSLHALNYKRAKDLNVKILYVGDPIQLPPVNRGEKESVASPTFKINSFELTEIIRQKTDNPLTKLLQLLVYDVQNNSSNFYYYLKKYPKIINEIGEGYITYTNHSEFLKSAIDCFKDSKFSDDPDYARLGAWKNATILAYNKHIRNTLIPYFNESFNNEVIDYNDLLIGYKTITDEFNDLVITNSEDYVIKSIVPRTAQDGFASYGITIEPRHGGKAVDINLVNHLDESFRVFYEKIRQYYFKAIHAHYSDRRTKWREYFDYKNSHLTLVDFPIMEGDKVKTVVTKDLDYAFSLTIHKLQGSTIENVFIDVHDMLYYSTGKIVNNTPFAPNAIEIRNKLIYTAISRTSKVAHIYLK
jgi:hypothetical protein